MQVRFTLKVIEGDNVVPATASDAGAKLEICAGCGAVKDVEDMSEFICCDKLYCVDCSCACPVFDVEEEDD